MSKDISLIPDEELLLLYRDTQEKLVIGELFKRHSLLCFTVCMKYLKEEEAAEDAAMNIFEKLFKDLQQHEVQNFRSWLHSVCRNHCLMLLRKQDLLINMDLQDDEENRSLFMEFDVLLHQEENAAEKEHRLQQLENAISALKDTQRKCIELFYLQQKSYEEICNETGFTSNEVKSHIQNGKRNLKISLANKGIVLGLALITWIHHSA